MGEEIEKHAGDGPRAALSAVFTSSRPFSRNMSLKPALHHFRQLFEGLAEYKSDGMPALRIKFYPVSEIEKVLKRGGLFC